MPSVLFVCLGNICRSPAAEGVLRELASKANDMQNLYIESCGIGSWHVGHLPDIRMQEAARQRGVILSSRAQQFTQAFFDRFDYILAVDHEVLDYLYPYAKTAEHKAKLHLITEFSPTYKGQEIPDPFYGNSSHFDLVLDMLDDSCEGFIEFIRTTKF